MDQTDKNSFSGRVIREYLCPKCGHTDWEDGGVALWQVLHDAREQDEAEAAARAAANATAAQPESQQPAGCPRSLAFGDLGMSPNPNPRTSLWQRLIGHVRRGK